MNSKKCFKSRFNGNSIAVIIPYYNGSEFIQRALNSVYQQTYMPQEVIVVNDGSNPKESEFIENLSKEIPFTLIHQDNQGQGGARNSGAAASDSDYICFLDQDDFFLPEHNEILAQAIPKDSNKFGWVYGDVQEADGHGEIIRTSMVKEYSTHPKNNLFHLLSKDMFVLPSASLISKVAFESVGGFDSEFTGYEDDDLFLRLFRKGFTNIFVDKSVTVWCIHMSSTSYSIKMSRSRFKYFTKLVQQFPNEKDRSRFFLKDCLMPRFEPLFISDVVKNLKYKTKYFDEVLSIFEQYCRVVFEDKRVRFSHKIRLRLLSFIFSKKLLMTYKVFKKFLIKKR